MKQGERVKNALELRQFPKVPETKMTGLEWSQFPKVPRA
jgi:hypothetical protein